MRLVYDSDSFHPIVKRLLKEEICEDGLELHFTPYPSKRIILKEKEAEGRAIFLNSTALHIYNQIKSFTIGKKNPGLLIISNKSYLKNGELANKLILDQSLPLKNVIFLGQHMISKAEFGFIEQNKLNFFSMKEISQEGYFEISESIMSIAKIFTDLFIYVDSNVLEYPTIRSSMPGGLTTRELIFFLQRFKMIQSFNSAALLVEPHDGRVAVKVLVEMFV